MQFIRHEYTIILSPISLYTTQLHMHNFLTTNPITVVPICNIMKILTLLYEIAIYLLPNQKDFIFLIWNVAHRFKNISFMDRRHSGKAKGINECGISGFIFNRLKQNRARKEKISSMLTLAE